MDNTSRAGVLKRAILLFWAAWVTVVVAMNVCDLLKLAGLLPAGWKFASDNYTAIVNMTEKYGIPHAVDLVLFLAIIVWEGGCAALLWWARARFRSGSPRRWRSVNIALAALFVLFAGFILGDEVFHDYKVERDHRSITVLLLASVLTLQLLPDRLPER